MNKFLKHFNTIVKHKIEVGKICFKFGIYWQGIIHDMSKFSFAEFIPSAKYFQGDSSPINAEKKDKGYSAAWLHHKAHNKHHQWYWMDWDDNQDPTPCRIPAKYVYEMVADWIGAGKVYGAKAGKTWNWSEPYEYYKAHIRDSKSGFPIWDYATRAMLDTIVTDLHETQNIDFVANNIKNRLYEFKFYHNDTTEDGREIYNWIFEYQELLKKYFNKGE